MIKMVIKMKYDVIIVGAGPAGLFAAYELITKNKELKILLLDQGKFAENRVCPMNKLGTKCANCNPCQILSGYGGAGTFSDGKLNFIPKLGKSDLFKYMSEEEAYKIIDDSEEIFTKFGMDSDVFPSNMDIANDIKKKVALTGARLLLIKQKHLGSDHLPEYIDGICDYLVENGVTLIDRADVTDIKTIDPDNHEVTYVTGSKETVLNGKNVIVAPGRTGAKWIQELADKYNIPYLSQSIEIGVRVEVRKEILEDITNVIYDPTIFIKTDTEKEISNCGNKKRKTEGNTEMKELAKRFIDKECVISSFDGNHQYEGIIKEVTDGAILVEKDGKSEAINLDFVIRIREYPRNKKGKKKSVVLD